MVKATTVLIDVTRKGMTVAGDVAELRLFAEARWCKQMGQAGSLLGIVTAGFELIHIAQAYRDGEPGRVVQWQLVGGGLTVATAVLGFLSLTASLVLVIGVVSMVLGILFTELASQAMTLAQRLWVHRGVFGLHHHRYHDSEAFGSTSTTGALVYLDRMTNALQIRHPFGGEKPFGLAPEALKAYHEKALNEETEALAMLVRGITLEIDVSPGMNNVDHYFPEYHSAQKADAPAVNNATAHIKLSVPAKVDGYIKIQMISDRGISEGGLEDREQPLGFVYKKVGDSITLEEVNEQKTLPPEFKHLNDMFVLKFNMDIEQKHYDMVFTLSTIEDRYIPIAQDRTSFKG